MTHILAIDQGTTSSRAILFDADIRPVASAQEEFAQHFPRSGWVEHDPADIWRTVVETCREVLASTGIGAEAISAIGITNQRETTLVWDRETGEVIHNAIVWQDRRTADTCARLRAEGHEPLITEITGLLLDPYFSGTKLAWLLDHVAGAREKARAGQLLFGTVDCYLIWKLTGARVHATDATNAARTLLYDIHRGAWSENICDLLDIPTRMLPEVRDCASDFGATDAALFGAEIPIRGVAGDQQAATIGQACFTPGMMKSTYGTGCFALLNTGATPVTSRNRLLTTIAYQLDGQPTYALEGAIFVAGAVVQWLRDGLGLIDNAGQTQGLAETSDPEQDLILVPAFTGLGAPYWSPEARGGGLWSDPRVWPGRDGPGGAGECGVPDPGSAGGHARGFSRRCRHGAACRRGHDGQRLDDAVPGRHHRGTGGPSAGAGEHGQGRGLAGWHGGGAVSWHRRIRDHLGAGQALRTGALGRLALGTLCGLAESGAGEPGDGLSSVTHFFRSKQDCPF